MNVVLDWACTQPPTFQPNLRLFGPKNQHKTHSPNEKGPESFLRGLPFNFFNRANAYPND